MQVDTGGYQTPTPWDDATWRQDVLDWISSKLSEAGTPVHDMDAIEVRLRPWSVVIRVPVPGRGDVWFKANPPSSSFEPALMAALSQWTPAHVLHPIAVDVNRALSLLPDGGALLLTTSSPESWIEPLRQYADLQQAVMPHAAELLRLGLPDLRPQSLPDRFDELMDEVGEREGMAEVAAMRPQVVDWAAELGSSGIPPTLDHSDLHENQIFAGTGGRYAFFDWGDASVGHPFTTLLVTMRTIRQLTDDESAPGRVRDAYLETWPGDMAALRRTAHVACCVGPVSRALSWLRIFIGERAPVHDYVLGWLRSLRDEPPI